MAKFGPGMPGILRLDAFAARIEDAFGELPFLVGSATRTKEWRDVDVRLILDDADFDALFGGPMEPPRMNLRWALVCDAMSELARAMTGLPVDFQIQRHTEANAEHGGEPRHTLGLRLTGQPWDTRNAPETTPDAPGSDALPQKARNAGESPSGDLPRSLPPATADDSTETTSGAPSETTPDAPTEETGDE